MIRLALALCFTACFTLATWLQPRFEVFHSHNEHGSSMLAAFLGDSRRLFANHFFKMADVYFHSGFYPTIFDHQKEATGADLKEALHEESQTAEQKSAEAKEASGFLGPPKDWIERFGRNFFPTVHTHLHGGNEREILPWLKLSAEMDPKRIETYVTAAYWLRVRLNNPAGAEEFLRDGLRANPESYEILLELGRVYFYSKNQPAVARHIWNAALQKWRKQDAARENPDPHVYEEILGELVRDDQKTGDQKKLLADLEELKKVSPSKDSIEQYIEQVKAKLAH